MQGERGFFLQKVVSTLNFGAAIMRLCLHKTTDGCTEIQGVALLQKKTLPCICPAGRDCTFEVGWQSHVGVLEVQQKSAKGIFFAKSSVLTIISVQSSSGYACMRHYIASPKPTAAQPKPCR